VFEAGKEVLRREGQVAQNCGIKSGRRQQRVEPKSRGQLPVVFGAVDASSRHPDEAEIGVVGMRVVKKR